MPCCGPLSFSLAIIGNIKKQELGIFELKYGIFMIKSVSLGRLESAYSLPRFAIHEFRSNILPFYNGASSRWNMYFG